MNEHQQVLKALPQKNYLDPTPKEPSGPSGSHSKRIIWSIWVSLQENHLVHLGPIIQPTNCVVLRIVISITINVYNVVVLKTLAMTTKFKLPVTFTQA